MGFWTWLGGLFASEDDDLSLDEASFAYWTLVQERLQAHGYDLATTGEWDDATDRAVRDFKRAHGYRDDRTLIGPMTLAALMDEPSAEPDEPDEPDEDGVLDWMVTAMDELGVKERHGRADNPRVVDYHSATDLGRSPDSVPWCGSYVAWVFRETGVPYSPAKKAAARAWLDWGQKLDGPAYGALVVFWRGDPNGWKGHVGFVAGRDKQGRLMVLGGNQSDAVSIAPFDLDRVLAYRWPEDEPLPARTGFSTLPVVDSQGRPSSADES